jgi:hypothetical protein
LTELAAAIKQRCGELPLFVYYAGKKAGQAFQPDVSGKSGWKA